MMTSYTILALVATTVFSVSNGVQLTLTMDTSKAPDLAEFAAKVKTMAEEIYPRISEYLDYEGYTSPTKIKAWFDPNCTEIGSSGSENIFTCAKYWRANSDHYVLFVDLIVFSIEKYDMQPRPDNWWTKGLARFFTRYWYEEKPVRKPKRSDNYRANDDFAAYLINYINTTYSMDASPDIIQAQHKDAREGKFAKGAYITRATGKTVNILWQEAIKQ